MFFIPFSSQQAKQSVTAVSLEVIAEIKQYNAEGIRNCLVYDSFYCIDSLINFLSRESYFFIINGRPDRLNRETWGTLLLEGKPDRMVYRVDRDRGFVYGLYIDVKYKRGVSNPKASEYRVIANFGLPSEWDTLDVCDCFF